MQATKLSNLYQVIYHMFKANCKKLVVSECFQLEGKYWSDYGGRLLSNKSGLQRTS